MLMLAAALVVGVGLEMIATGFLERGEQRDQDLATILGLEQLDVTDNDRDGIDATSDAMSHRAVLEAGVGFAQAALERANLMARVSEMLEHARLPMRPGEFVLMSGGISVFGALLAWFFTGQSVMALLVAVLLVLASWRYVLFKISRRRKAFEEQFPEALSLVASSLQAGHTFLRAIQMMVEEASPPLSEEFERVIAETRLGDPLVDALERMAHRLQQKDLAWVVQAIRIQQEVGGRLADLLFTLADFMRAREELRREVRVLTAEGRMSAYVMGALPVFTFGAIQMAAPGYMKPMLHGGGLAALAGAAGMVAFGVWLIMRMVKVEV
jgi:tight adherence protein B